MPNNLVIITKGRFYTALNNMIYSYVLATASSRRRDILVNLGINFEQIASDVDETVPAGADPETAAAELAKSKAQTVLEKRPDSCIIGADTIVVIDGEVLGKPKDEGDAYRMLKMLSGRTHTVMTGVFVLYNHQERSFVQKTEVKFYDLTEEQIDRYILSGEPLDKAGAYGIQGLGCVLVESINGDYFNVVGLPVARLHRELESLDG